MIDRRGRFRRRFLIIALTLGAVLQGGCEGLRVYSPADDETARVTEAKPAPPEPLAAAPPVVADEEVGIPADLNSARAAARHVAMLSPLADTDTLREIALHVALYRVAHQENEPHATGHFLLVPIPFESRVINGRDFRLRVLAELRGLDVPIAWATDQSVDADAIEFFPRTRDRAARLVIRIQHTSGGDDGSEVRAEVGEQLQGPPGDRRATGQGVTAGWDGERWSITRQGFRWER